MTNSELNQKIIDFVRSIAPAHSRVMFNESRTPWCDAKLCCHGTYIARNYYCGMNPGHDGPCYSVVYYESFCPDQKCSKCKKCSGSGETKTQKICKLCNGRGLVPDDE